MYNCVAGRAALVLIALGPSSYGIAADQSTGVSLIAKNYPTESLARGEQGIASFAVELDSDANIDTCVITKSSGFPRLDAATCDLIVVHAQFAPAESNGKRVATVRQGQIVWKLPEAYRENAKLAPQPKVVSAKELQAQKLICEKQKSTGSVVRSTTYCLTQNEWVAVRHDARLQVLRMLNPRQADHGCRHPSC